MIRPLQEADRAQAVALLMQARETNLYQLGNLEVHGVDGEFCQFWGNFDGAGRLLALLNRYHNGWTVYGVDAADWVGLGQLVDHHPILAQRLQDNPGGVDSFLPYLRRYQATLIEEETLMSLRPQDFHPSPQPPGVTVRAATLDDLERLTQFYADAEEMTRSPAGVADPLRHRRIWLVEADGEICAAALTNGEIREQAMIGGVFTPPAHRGRGYSQAVVSALCQSLLAEGRQPVLYWINPVAGGVYRKLGFKSIGRWRAVRLAKRAEQAEGSGQAKRDEGGLHG
jgi:predicted GNAT family acetyltransferase